jgi:hypothetical protein
LKPARTFFSILSFGDIMIKAKAWSDCRQLEVSFDATKWAEQATDTALVDLAKCDCRCDYPADDVVIFMADHDSQAAKLFEFLQIVTVQPFSMDTNGFECEVDPDDFKAWLESHKPHLVKLAFI